MLRSLDADTAEELRALLPARTVEAISDRYLEEPRGRWSGNAEYLARPRSAEEVSTIVRFCAQARIGLVPYGGGTGLVGGQVSTDTPKPLVLSLERMNAISAPYSGEHVLIAQAGAVLAEVQDKAAGSDLLFPLSLASEGSAQIGGLLSTNAGGTGVLRYGNARDLCLGIEAVLPNGDIYHGLKRLRKDNTGYDLRHLMIGAEGTLGIITAASLKLFPKPQAVGTALLAVPSPQAALGLLGLARALTGDALSAFELIHRKSFEFLLEACPEIRQPWPKPPDWCVLVEFSVSGADTPSAMIEKIFAAGTQAEWITDGIVAQNAREADQLWQMREHIPEANRRIGAISSHDISLPLSAVPGFIEAAGSALAQLGAFRINCFGHLGDGNLHYNVFPKLGETREAHVDKRDRIKRLVHDLVHSYDGSVSAEHGIGRLKVTDLQRYGDPAKLSAMRAIKAALDPVGIMNPGAVLG